MKKAKVSQNSNAKQIEVEKNILDQEFRNNSTRQTLATSACNIDRKKVIMQQILQSLLRSAATSFTTNNFFARLKFHNLNSYLGWIDSNGLNGFGTYTFSSGASLKGIFEESLARGLGSLVYANGDVYEGEFLAGRRHGYGQYKSLEFQYIGKFKNGNFHGRGTLKTRTKEIDGTFHYGKISQGKARDKSGTFSGTFNKCGLRKRGKCIFTNGTTYNGFWCGNRFDGFGEYNWVAEEHVAMFSECKYLGYWKNGKQHGLGMLIFNQRRIICQWLCGQKSGAGIIIACNGTCFSSKELFINDQYIQSQCVKNCQESQILFKKATNILTLNSEHETLDSKIKAFLIIVNQLVDQHSTYSCPINPIYIPNYDIPEAFSTPCQEWKHLQQVLVENYEIFKDLYNRYTYVKSGCLSNLGLNLFYMDVFHQVPDINIVNCLRAGHFEISQTRYLDDINVSNPIALISFYDFFQHFVYAAKVLFENETLKSKALELMPTFFSELPMKVLLLINILQNNESSLLVVREGVRHNFPDIVKLLDIIEKMFPGEKSIRTAFKFLKAKDTINGRCTEFCETIEKLYGATYSNISLCDIQLSNLEVIEIIFRTCQLKLLNDKITSLDT